MCVMSLILQLGGLVACANDSRTGLEARLSPLVGQPEIELARRLGPPTRISGAADDRMLVYFEGWPVNGNLNYPNDPYPTPPDRFCEISFQVRQGNITGYALRGATCGLGGRPLVLPA